MVKINPSEITPEHLYLSRRRFIKGLGLAAAGAALLELSAAVAGEAAEAAARAARSRRPLLSRWRTPLLPKWGLPPLIHSLSESILSQDIDYFLGRIKLQQAYNLGAGYFPYVSE